MRYSVLTILCVTILMLSSCTEFYFPSPQPIDSENIYTVPEELTGTWVFPDADGRQQIDSVVIAEDYYKYIHWASTTKHKDSLAADSNAYFINDKIYYKEDNTLREFDYILNGDSITFAWSEVVVRNFGEYMFLRKVNYGYILNLQKVEKNDWWHIRFIDTRNKEGFIIRDLDKNDLSINHKHNELHEDLKNYIVADWSLDEMNDFIDYGGFSDSTFFLKYDERVAK